MRRTAIPWIVLSVWLVLFGLCGWLAGLVEQDNDETNWMPADAQSTQAVRLAEREFPESDQSALIVVYARDGGLTDADRAAVQHDKSELAPLADGPVTGPEASPDGAATVLTVPVAGHRLESGDVERVVTTARERVAAGLPAGLAAETTGPASFRVDSMAANGSVDGMLTLVTLAVVVLLMLFIYRSPLLPLVALVCVVFGNVVAQGALYLVTATGAVVSGTSFVLMVVLVFGLGTDYALLLIARYREELPAHADRRAAMAVAVRRTVPSVLASAGTMVLAALALLAADMNSTRGLAPVVAVAVVAAALVMLTLLPALLVVLGRVVFWPRTPVPGTPPAPGRGWWQKTAGWVSRRPRRAWAGVVLLLAALTAGTAVLDVGPLNGGDNFLRKPGSVVGQELIAAHFPGGTTAPVTVFAPAAVAGRVATEGAATPGASAVRPPELSRTGDWARLDMVLAGTPDSAEARESVRRLRDRLAEIDEGVLVGGRTAAALDQHETMNRDLSVVPPLVIAVVVLVLAVLLRAVVAPLVLLVCALLSAGAALGLSSLLFVLAGFAHTDQSVLILGFLFLVALGVDYTIFLMARAREEVRRRGHRTGLVHALVSTGGVITSAGVVLAATFLVLTITPVVLNVQLGLLVALGVLIDALIVRAVLVPALALDIGARTWWPSRLARQESEIGTPRRYANTTS